ncbi:hypothetical protein BG005_009734 [Podila minutissima]|nr:hypothetical protein BG005_009734 [Podila minutissima]
MLLNRAWFKMVAPFLYQSPLDLIDATWPKLSQYCQVLNREPQVDVSVQAPPFSHESSSQPCEPSIASPHSPSFNERVGRGTDPGVGSSRVVTRTQSRSSSHSSTRSLTVDAFHHDRHEAVHERDRLIRRKKFQVLWLLLNCTITDQEYEAANSPQPIKETFMSLERRTDLDISVDYFKPATDYLSLYTHYHHPGLSKFIWRLFPAIEDAAMVEQRLVTHNPERIRELYLESVQLQDIISLAPRLSCLYRIRTRHESWDIHGCIDFMKEHNARFGTVRMLELEADIPEQYDTTMEENVNELIATVDHLRTLELSGFETLTTDLERIPRGDLKVLRLNCGSLGPNMSPNTMSTTSDAMALGSKEEGPMIVSRFLSQCRKLEELFLKAVDEDMLGWAVLERRNHQAAQQSCPSSPSIPLPLSDTTTTVSLVPLRIIELSGDDSEHVAMTISQAAEAFQDTLQVIKANSYSYQSNRTLTSLTWKCPMPRLEVIKIVGRSNLPFDFRSLQYCPALKILDISKYSGMRACSEALLLNMRYLTQLEYLGLSSFDHLADSTVRTILGCMPRLKHLRLALKDTPTWNMSGSSSAASSGGSSAMPNPSSSSSPTSSAASSVQEGSTTGITSGMRITGMTGDLNTRLNFAAMSVSSQSPAPSSTSSASPSPVPMTQLGQPGYRATSLPPPLPSGSSSLRPSLMDRFQMENNYLSLDGILDAIRGLRESKRLEKLSVVLPKVDYEENFHRLEMYNLQHPDLEIVVYRYAHGL